MLKMDMDTNAHLEQSQTLLKCKLNEAILKEKTH